MNISDSQDEVQYDYNNKSDEEISKVFSTIQPVSKNIVDKYRTS